MSHLEVRGAADAAAPRTVCEAFQRTVAAHPELIALRTPGGAVELTFAEYAARVRSVAAGLEALGVGRGDTVGILLPNRPEFNIFDTAAMHLGATPFSIYNTSSAEQIAYVLSNAGNAVLITEQQFLEVIRAAGADRLEHIVCIDGARDGTLGVAELEARGVGDFDFESRWRAVAPDDVITLCYTSGTTGPPKGVQLTHANVLAQAYGLSAVVSLVAGDRSTSYLPHAHMADRQTFHYNAMVFGFEITLVADAKQIADVLPEVRPTYWTAVPRIWEKLRASLQAQGILDPTALSPGARRDALAQLGLDRCRIAFAGAAPMSPELLQYFAALGLTICETWGMTELTCVGTCNPPGRVRFGTVGLPLGGVEVKLASDGELLCRGPILMKGYRADPERTAEAVDAAGWMHTGDVATIDEDGYVAIVDRKKDIIINAAGKNMSPANIEAQLKASSPLIGQAAAIGDGRPYNVALIVLDPVVAVRWATDAGIDATPEALAADDSVLAEVERGVAEANTHLSRVEQIKRFAILPTDWLPGGSELTPTMKLKRKDIARKYAGEIEALYA